MGTLRHLTLIDTLTRGGGAEQALLSLLPELKKRGFQPEVATLWPPDDLAGDLEAQGIPVHRLDMDYRHRWTLPYTLAKTTRLIQKVKPDILHAHLFFGVIYGGLSPRYHRNMVRVMSIHNMDYDPSVNATGTPQMRKRLHGRILRHRYDECVAVSETAKTHYAKHFRLDNLSVIANPIPVETIRPSSNFDARDVRRKHRIPTEVPLLVMPGRLIPQKGHETLVNALSIVRNRGIAFHCALIGRGFLRASIAQLIQRNNLSQCIQLLGVLPHAEVMELVQAASCVVVPSVFEGFGIVAAEAMALERPVIASDIGALAEFVQHEETGLLCPARDPDALADAIVRLLTVPDLGRRLGREGRRLIHSRFSTTSIADAWCAEYGRLQASHHEPRQAAR